MSFNTEFAFYVIITSIDYAHIFNEVFTITLNTFHKIMVRI